ncbi:uncharacterized mitochondrial protein AtMg00240-like [Gastrolobium bilobum]|uniref:uncharacterized mitochondrial protein AtMg00240-like n=1 Tax=Gastrolobium bilobum TaxID=150636 RepID=UPI002AAFA456|nr:uncharacterized mitochondrial protein AtMg00240-like [Gastrolobium bilobum]
MDVNLKLSSTNGDPLPDPTSYRRLIGRLLYLTITRPDLSFAVNHLSQYMADPRVPYLQEAHRILASVKSTVGQDNRVFHERTKHIEIDYHLIRDCIVRGQVKTFHIASSH